MNELIALLSFVTLAMFVVTAARLGTVAMFVLSVTFIMLSNITVAMTVRAFGEVFPWAIIVYSLVYLITNLICEFQGPKMAYKLAVANLGIQIILWAYVWTSLQVAPTTDGTDAYNAMGHLYATTKQVSVAALLASAGPFFGVYVYCSVREKWERHARQHASDATKLGRLLKNQVFAMVVRNKIATFAGQILNSAIFFTVADFNTHTAASIVAASIIRFSVVKIVIALADVPFLIAGWCFLMARQVQPSSIAALSEL